VTVAPIRGWPNENPEVKVFSMLEVPPNELRPLSRVEYMDLAGLGRFDDERVELLYGSIVRMSPPNPPHDGLIQRLTRLFIERLSQAQAAVRIQSAFVASDYSMPEPDVAIVPPGSYLDAHPAEAWLIVEVAASSLRKDRVLKSRLYAECGVPEYWVVDVEANVVEVRTRIESGAYTRVETHGKDARIALVRFPDVVIEANEILR
jgi:Uma2 family endonuclease